MKRNKNTIISKIALAILTVILGASCVPTIPAFAGEFSLSPMYQFITLSPGETYVGNFDIVNPGTSESDFYYSLRVEPFSVDDNNEGSLVAYNNGDYNMITDWIELKETEGVIPPNSNKEVRFYINVPEDAPAGGQYASIVVSSAEHRVDNTTVDLREIYESVHLIYADVVGETVRKGEINDIDVPSFLFSGSIAGSSKIKNNGNVHSRATHTLQIFPLFSNEEVFTNEENPDSVLIMPGNTRYTSIEWDQTPSIGIFHVIYNVEFEGVNQKVDKIVIVCPLWLLFIIAVVIFLTIFKILNGKKENK